MKFDYADSRLPLTLLKKNPDSGNSSTNCNDCIQMATDHIQMIINDNDIQMMNPCDDDCSMDCEISDDFQQCYDDCYMTCNDAMTAFQSEVVECFGIFKNNENADEFLNCIEYAKMGDENPDMDMYYDGILEEIRFAVYNYKSCSLDCSQEEAKYYLAYDQVGSLRIVADVEGNIVKQIDYDSFGNIINDTNPAFNVPFGFAGGLYDKDTGLVKFGFRDYDSDTRRWTAKDPIGFAGGDVDLYGYCLNDPINFIDSLGLSEDKINWWDEVKKIGKGLINAGITLSKKGVDFVISASDLVMTKGIGSNVASATVGISAKNGLFAKVNYLVFGVQIGTSADDCDLTVTGTSFYETSDVKPLKDHSEINEEAVNYKFSAVDK